MSPCPVVLGLAGVSQAVQALGEFSEDVPFGGEGGVGEDCVQVERLLGLVDHAFIVAHEGEVPGCGEGMVVAELEEEAQE